MRRPGVTATWCMGSRERETKLRWLTLRAESARYAGVHSRPRKARSGAGSGAIAAEPALAGHAETESGVNAWRVANASMYSRIRSEMGEGNSAAVNAENLGNSEYARLVVQSSM